MLPWIQRLYWALVAAYVSLCVLTVVSVPGRVPIHWGVDGRVDRWAGRIELGALFALLGVMVPGLLGAVAVLVPRSARLTGLNVPDRDYWLRPEHLPRARRMAQEDLTVIAALGTGIACVVPVMVGSAAPSTEAALPVWGLVAVGGLTVALLGYCVWMSLARWKAPRAG